MEALASAYNNNPDLNAFRAQVRAVDEAVPQAKSGFRPTVNLSGQVGVTSYRSGVAGSGVSSSGSYYPRAVSLSIEQPLFAGFRTVNGVKMAKNSVAAAREQLRNQEQTTLLDAVTAFMDVVEAQVILNLRAQNVSFLREQVKASTDRLNVGEGTKTDVAQANSSLQSGLYDYSTAVANVNAALARYEQIVGHKPKSLGAVDHVELLLPKSLDAALNKGGVQHPGVVAALFNVDVAAYNVKIAEGAFLPTAGLTGSLTHADGSSAAAPNAYSNSASLMAQLNIPIYDGGNDSSLVRQAKETLSQRRIELDSTRAQVRQIVISAWGNLIATRAQEQAAQAQVEAAQLALNGVIEERKVGQRTTLDVLNAQQTLLSARVSQVQAQHDRVVAAYTLLAAVGGLDARTLRLRVNLYDPSQHYNAVKDKWYGLRTPDGR
ncbi:MAG: TolC family outer membrane protein [Rhizobiales bacterium]|nr:TolC family outer membrane protein [Hyphomicrobiales bacterium]